MSNSIAFPAPAQVSPASGAFPRHDTAASLLGHIEWATPEQGYCTCPGQHLHGNRDGKRDCRVSLDGAPTLYCFHSSCAAIVEQTNRALRSAIGQCERGHGAMVRNSPSPDLIERRRQEQADRALAERAQAALSKILAEHETFEADVWESSPTRLDDDARNDWRLLLHLFAPDDVLWIGGLKDSGPGHERNFRAVSDWLKRGQEPGNFTCPSVFKNNSFSRSNDSVLCRPFLVVESDTLKRGETLALFQWLRNTLTLRAIVDTGGKSLHGWFDFPNAKNESALRVMLPAMECDPALFRPAQPCRLPGAFRAEKNKFQSLLYLAL